MLRALRAFGLVAGAILGWQFGLLLSVPQGSPDLVLIVLMTTVGASLGFLLAPFGSIYPLKSLRHQIDRLTLVDLTVAGVGLLIGLIIAALAAIPLALLPYPFGQFLPVLVAAFFAYLSVASCLARRHEIMALIRRESLPAAAPPRALLLDTSAVIDGRINDVSATGFLDGELVVPRFVLAELQQVADSTDVLRRNRGRRGLEMLNRLQKDSTIPVRIIETSLPANQTVDAALVNLALELQCPIVTTDYNLNRVASIQGVRVLNLNELANAVRPVVLPGEELIVQVVQEGKEASQGVAYLDDGTMVVIDHGRRAIGSERRVVVTRVIQTVAGRMIFAALRDGDAPLSSSQGHFPQARG